jgi:hypothetical protein
MSIWSHGKYVDMWSLIHFLSGIMISGIAFLFLQPFSSFVFVFVVAVLWEVFEAMVGIGEDIANYVTDIVIAVVGYVFTYFLYYVFDKPLSNELLALITLVTGLLSLWGFLDMKRRQWKR